MSLGQCSPETLLGATDPGKSSIRSVDPETGHSKFKFEEVIVSNGSVYNGLFVLKNTKTLQIIKSSQISCVVGLGLLLNGDETTTNPFPTLLLAVASLGDGVSNQKQPEQLNFKFGDQHR